MPIPAAARFKARVSSRSLVGTAGSHLAEGMNVCLLRDLYVFRGICDGLITRPGSYAASVVSKCDLEAP
jgi:hypothetical protein